MNTDGQIGKLVATDNHPFWAPDLRKWVTTDEFRAGSLLQTSQGVSVQVSAVRKWSAYRRVHNLSVDRLHTYYVFAGIQPVLVHNSNGCPVIAGAKLGSLRVTAKSPSTSEVKSAQHMAAQGHDVTLRDPVGTRAGGGTSDLLVDGVRWDVFTPKTANPDRIVSAAASKGKQVLGGGVIIDLANTTVKASDLANIQTRVAGTGARVSKIVVIE